MKVVHVLASVASSWGGPPRAVRDLTSGLSHKGVENVVIGLEDASYPSVAFPKTVRLLKCGNAAIFKLGVPMSTALLVEIVKEVKDADLVHLHELWHVPHILGAHAAAGFEHPTI